MEMFIQLTNIQRYMLDNGTLPNGLDEVGERVDGVQYTRLADGVFQLSGKTGDITVDYTSTEPEEDLLGDARAIVSGVSATPGGAGADD